MSSFDQEVEKYLGFGFDSRRTIGSTRKFSCAITPGRLKSQSDKTENKRPSSAAAIYSPESKTPCKSAPNNCQNNISASSCRRKTPISSRRRIKTPCSRILTPKTPKESDRFIPPRGSNNFSTSHHKIMSIKINDNENDDRRAQIQNSSKYDSVMGENLTRILGESNSRVLQYQSKVNSPGKGPFPPVKAVVNSNSCKKNILRKIPAVPERVLDAPNYVDDYYLNLMHWSSSVDLLAVALDHSVYLWTPSTGDINHLCQVDEPENYVSSLQWVEEGCHLAVGTVNGCIQLWDTVQKKRLRQMSGHAARVSSLSWNSHVVSSGCRSGDIFNHDVRIAEHRISTFSSHTQEVCGLAWSPSGRYLASGSNDNKVAIWDWNQVRQNADDTRNNYIHSFNQHKAAVKAVAWCPWQHHILATGGGSADKCIRFWNINSGNCLNTIETNSQVSSLLWNEPYKEIVSGHGYPNNQLTIWQYPSMTKKIDLLGHTCRVLQMTMSPDKTRVISAAGDETLRMWHCFELTKQQKKEKAKNNIHLGSMLSMANIR